MAERKQTNKYYPPDYDPKRGGLNKFHGTHALRERANKLHLGILVIRFEMPFNVWCEGCDNHVGIGVRYNAEKKQVGMFYTTPIYEFRMKCHLCDNYFVIKTDPEHFDYTCVEGVRRQDRRWDPAEHGQISSTAKEVSRKLATDAMYKLEHVENDMTKSKKAETQIEHIEAIQSRMRDDFSSNQLLRSIFRTKKKEIKKQNEIDQQLLVKSSLDIPLVPESEDDKQLASMMAKYRTVNDADETALETLERLDRQSIFAKRSVKRKAQKSSGLSAKTKKLAGFKSNIMQSHIQEKISKLDRDLDQQQASKSFIRRKSAHSETEAAASVTSTKMDSETEPGQSSSGSANTLSLIRCAYGSSDSSSECDNSDQDTRSDVT